MVVFAEHGEFTLRPKGKRKPDLTPLPSSYIRKEHWVEDLIITVGLTLLMALFAGGLVTLVVT